MADVFISYCSNDEALAKHVHRVLTAENVTAFLAAISLQPGVVWEPAIRAELKRSPWVIFLASRAACASACVQQELGGAWLMDKQILPVVWDMAPSELPGFLSKYQALDLRNGTMDQLTAAVGRLSANIKADKLDGVILVGALVLVVIGLLGSSKS